MSLKDGSTLSVEAFVVVSSSTGNDNAAPVQLRGSITYYRRPVNVSAHNCYNSYSVPFFPLFFNS